MIVVVIQKRVLDHLHGTITFPHLKVSSSHWPEIMFTFLLQNDYLHVQLHSATGKTMNTWNVSGMFIVL